MASSGVLIVGGGLAGLFCALKLAPRPVTILTAAPLGMGASSAWAQGGIAAAVSPGDTAEKHTADTLAAGAGIVDEAVTLGMAREAALRIHELLELGVPFDRDLEGALLTSREAAHGERRIVRVKGDGAGQAIMEALVLAVLRTPSIKVLAGYVAEELIMDDGRVTGVKARAQDGSCQAIYAHAVVLATGGIGHLYAVTTNPLEANGGGLAIAARAGALTADCEFVQFHPTAINVARDPAPLATEALRGEGATLINDKGERFMAKLHPDAELAPRDIVARGVFAELEAGRGAFLDCRAAVGAHFPTAFPAVNATCQSVGIDPVTMPIPVAPAAHYHMGGIWTDTHARTSLPGLWAAGETASTGVHGANRLASNSLLEAVVFAARAAQDIVKTIPADEVVAPMQQIEPPQAMPDESMKAKRLRDIMTRHVGVIRNADGLKFALEAIDRIEAEATSVALRNKAVVARLVTAGALQRHESRGGHFRSDFPKADDTQANRTFMTLADARNIH